MQRELEVKVLNIDVDIVVEKLKKLSAKFLKIEHQKNYHIQSTKLNIIPNGSYLRIRELLDEDENVLSSEITYKENIKNEKLRENNEFNVNISDTKTMIEILKFLGYDCVDVAQKKRISFEFLNSRIDIDSWDKDFYPFSYMEIETKDFENVYKILDLLNIDRENISLKSIKQLQDELKE